MTAARGGTARRAAAKGATARRVGLTPERVVDRAQELTARLGLDGWSLRQLAEELDVVPSVVYHYYPTKEDVCDAVVERVGTLIALPDPSLGWKEWFTAMLLGARPVLLEYHGVADRIMRGEFTRGFAPMIDTAVAKLQEAGFADLAPMAYAMISNSAISAIAARNRRSAKQGASRHDLALMMDHMEPVARCSPGARLMIDHLFNPLSSSERGEDLSEEYFGLLLASLLEGVERVVLPRAQALDHGSECGSPA